MRASEVLRKIIPDVLDAQHAARRRVLLRAVDALAEGGRLPLMDLARSARGYTHVWAPLKAFDRLLSNRHLWAEHSALYQALNAPWEDQRRPVLVVDWSDTKADRSIHLLRAARPVGSRALPVLDRVFGATEQQTAKAHAQFLAQLRRMMPDGAKPILICDAGFGVRWFRQAQAAGFTVIARLRGVSHVAPVGSDAFVALTTLHDGATATPEDLGHFHITQQHREPLRLIRVRLDDRHRRKLTAAHKPARRNDCARANAEPCSAFLPHWMTSAPTTSCGYTPSACRSRKASATSRTNASVTPCAIRKPAKHNGCSCSSCSTPWLPTPPSGWASWPDSTPLIADSSLIDKPLNDQPLSSASSASAANSYDDTPLGALHGLPTSKPCALLRKRSMRRSAEIRGEPSVEGEGFRARASQALASSARPGAGRNKPSP